MLIVLSLKLQKSLGLIHILCKAHLRHPPYIRIQHVLKDVDSSVRRPTLLNITRDHFQDVSRPSIPAEIFVGLSPDNRPLLLCNFYRLLNNGIRVIAGAHYVTH